MMRVVALVDGEHAPSVTRWGLDTARALGYEVAACLFLGGTEKLPGDGSLDLGGVPVEGAGRDPAAALVEALRRHGAGGILDLSDEPVLGYRERLALAGVALDAGASYIAPDFTLEPPVTGPPLPVPTLAVIGTGKRTGKTAIAGEAARATADRGLRPVIVAMGRGGPPVPRVAEAGSVDLTALRDLVRSGEHGASDYLEDAVTTGVTTVGARRCGGGLAGRPFVTNVREAADRAVEFGAGLVILEGSGASIPPVPWDAGVLVCPASVPVEYVAGYLGPFRLLRSDAVVLTMAAGPGSGADLADLVSHIRRLRPDTRLVVTDFRPVPLGDVQGKKVYLTTTASPEVGPALVRHLEGLGCTVVGASHRLADRSGLAADLDAAPPFDALLTELKAAAVDVAAERAEARGAEVVFVDNRADTLEGDGDLPSILLEAADLAVRRSATR